MFDLQTYLMKWRIIFYLVDEVRFLAGYCLQYVTASKLSDHDAWF
jgi:hypothetical protein